MTNRDLLLDKTTNDLIVRGFDLQVADGSISTEQRLKVKLQIFLGEWFLNRTAGLPYQDAALSKTPDLVELEARLKESILSVEKVLEITAFQLNYNNSSRGLSVNFSVNAEGGNIVMDDEINIAL